MIIAIWRNLWHWSVGKRPRSFFTFSMRCYRYIVNLLFWVPWVCLAKQAQSMLSTCRKPSCLFAGKNQLYPHVLLEILQRYANFLFWVLWTCLVAHSQNDSINLYNTLMFICMQKTNFIIHFNLEILNFKESCNLSGSSNLRTASMKIYHATISGAFNWI